MQFGYCTSQIFELRHIFEGFIRYQYIMILSRIFVTRYNHILSLSVFTCRPTSLPASNRASVFYFSIFMFSPNIRVLTSSE